jgi:hypothetical protein
MTRIPRVARRVAKPTHRSTRGYKLAPPPGLMGDAGSVVN